MEKGNVLRNMQTEQADLFVPPLEQLAIVLEKALQQNYKQASCSVVYCPDLTQKPFGLAAPGICGSTRLVEIGGVPNLVPCSRYIEKVYDLQVVRKQIELPDAFIIGAGAGSKHVVGTNCEMIPNVKFSDEVNGMHNLTQVSKVNQSNEESILEGYGEKYNSTEFGLLCNLFCSQGKRGQVLKVSAKHRTGDENLVSCMRKAIESHYGPDKPVGMGGTFLTKSGKLKIHVMPEFSETPLNSEEDVTNWLKFYSMKSPFVCMSTLVSHDPGLDLRIEHTHGYSVENNEGGHYHTDVTPEEVEYEGYYCPAGKIYRIDKPEVTHMIGRD